MSTTQVMDAPALPATDAAGAADSRGSWWRAWGERFGLAELCGTLAAAAGFAAGYLVTGSLLAAAGLATACEAIGFYGCVGAKTAAVVRGGGGPGRVPDPPGVHGGRGVAAPVAPWRDMARVRARQGRRRRHLVRLRGGGAPRRGLVARRQLAGQAGITGARAGRLTARAARDR